MQSSAPKPPIVHLSTLCAAAALALAPQPAGAQSLEFGQTISLQSDHGRFLVAEPDGRLDADRDVAGSWERFRLVDPADLTSIQTVRFGDSVALHSAHGTYLVAEADGSARADRPNLGPWETWTLTNPHDPASTAPVRARDVVAWRSHHGLYLVAEPNGRADANRAAIGPWETWRIGGEWTDFYYDQAPACPSGECCACPYRGRFDGANCFVARPPAGAAPSLLDGEFVYQSPGNGHCPLGSFDGSVCRVGSNPVAPPPFVYDGGFYLSSLCSPDGELRVTVERVAHCAGSFGPPLCDHQLTRDEFAPWQDGGVPEGIQQNTQLGVVFGPAQGPARRVALLMAGQQFDQPFEPGSGNLLTGQPDGFKQGWSFREASRPFTLDDRSVAHRLVEELILDPADSFLAVAFDARFNHKFNRDNKDRIENAYFRWLRSKFDPQQVELVYLAGHSRGGCLAMRLAKRLQEEMPSVPVVAQSFDGVCNRNQGELGIEIPGRVKNPLLADDSAYAWPTDLRQEFSNQESTLALLQVVGGHPFFPGDLAVRPFSQKRADEPELDLCWYQQRWVDLSHGQLGGFRSVQPALDHLDASLERFAQGPPCPAVGECVKDPVVITPFECNDLLPQDCETQTECRPETRCRHVSGFLTCDDLGSEAECQRYGTWCRWRTRGRDHCVHRLGAIFRPFECNDLSTADCGNHGECGLSQECRLQTGSLTCSDLFTREQCDRYPRWCDWR